MSEHEDMHDDERDERDDEFSGEDQGADAGEMEHVVPVRGMYNDYFLDYASYVILERAVPHQHDGLKPVQRRILHSLREMDDGRFHKVANVIGNTMKYHPHGDASIGDAMVQIGQRELLLDCQGNWGNILTGDRAAAPRYIEVKLSKFALEVLFNAKTTTWLSSYDGRNKEPETLPVKWTELPLVWPARFCLTTSSSSSTLASHTTKTSASNSTRISPLAEWRTWRITTTVFVATVCVSVPASIRWTAKRWSFVRFPTA